MTAKFTGFSVEHGTALVAELGTTRIVARSSQPFGSNASVRAWVGTAELQGISVDQFGITFEGFLASAPAATDQLSVQIDGSDKIDTGLVADPDPPVA